MITFNSILSLKKEGLICFCNKKIESLYQEKILKLGPIFSFPEGECFKSRETKEQLEDALFQKQVGKEIAFVAIGGGVTLDLIGYLAATYLRGVELYFVPTTLLATIDACIGGKNGVNTPYGKNLIGTYYLPKEVIIDLDFFQTLPKEEILNGIAEGLKHGLILDPLILEQDFDALFKKDQKELRQFIEKNLRVKSFIVEQSQSRPQMRHLLNFGHTLAHSIESCSNYTLSHGTCLFLGISFAIYLSPIEMDKKWQIWHFIDQLGIEQTLPFPIDTLVEKMKYDKKGFGQFILLEEIGSVKFNGNSPFTTFTEAYIKKALQDWVLCLSKRSCV
jgi:3-dehydroquinate synthase